MRPHQRKWSHDNNHQMPAPEPALVVGCHGGAGSTTITRLLGDFAVEWWDPFSARVPPLCPTVFVTHANVYGALRAAETLGRFSDLAERPAVLVATEDGRGPLPGNAKLRFHVMEGIVPIVTFPYVMRWRYADDPLEAGIPLAVRRVIRQLRRDVFPQAASAKG